MSPLWFEKLRSSASTRRPRRHSRKRSPARASWFQPHLERLENRTLLTINVSVSNPVPLPEGDSGESNMVFVVSRSGNENAFTVNYQTANGTAVAGTDYVATSGTLSFAANQNSATVDVPVIGNTIFQSNRTFTLALSPTVTSFDTEQIVNTPEGNYAVTTADINGDGKPDIIATSTFNGAATCLSTPRPPAQPRPASPVRSPSTSAPTHSR